jgi:hypothetical protein
VQFNISKNRTIHFIRQFKPFRNRVPHALITRLASFALADACPDRALLSEIPEMMARWATASTDEANSLIS